VGTFGFVVHPLEARDVARKFPVTRWLPDFVVEGALKYMRPVVTSHVTGIESPHGSAEGWFVGIALSSRQFGRLREDFVLNKIIGAGRLAERLGAKILGLGAFTSIVGDAGVTVARNLDIAVTTGNSYTVATAIEGTSKAAELMGIDVRTAALAVVGATGSIGRACARILARDAGNLILVGRDEARLRELADVIVGETGLRPRVSVDLKKSLRSADVIVTVSSAVEAVIEPEDLKPGAVVCDVARPRDVSRKVAETRDDVLVIEGGVVEPPGDVDFGIDFGFPPGMAMACMAETMILALEQRYENYTIGRDIEVAKVDEIDSLARKHGFRLAGLRSFERALSREEIERIRRNAETRRALGRPAS